MKIQNDVAEERLRDSCDTLGVRPQSSQIDFPKAFLGIEPSDCVVGAEDIHSQGRRKSPSLNP